MERSACRATGYQMLKSISIRNFRIFKNVNVDECRRINILVGENGSGKTALLEALFLAAGASPELVLRTRAWRGVESDRVSGTMEDIHKALWADLFHKFQTRQQAVIKLQGTSEENRHVTIKLTPPGHRRVEPPSRRRPGASPKVVTEPSGIEFKWTVQGRIVATVSPKVEDGQMRFPPVPESIVRAIFFPTNRIAPSAEIANRFSLLSRTFRDDEFIEYFHKLYADIYDLSVDVATGVPMLYAAVDGLPEKIPLSLASGGMNKLASILLAMSHQPKGLILIDEIENGFYYKRLPIIWKAIVEFARQYECQIFASTHSIECLESVSALAAENPDEFCVMRTVQKAGEGKIRSFGGDKFADAVAENIEIR